MEGLLGNNVVVQIGMVVDDIEKATRAWAAFLGMEEPAISMTDEYPVTKTQYRGAPSKARCRQSFFPLGAQVNLSSSSLITSPPIGGSAWIETVPGFIISPFLWKVWPRRAWCWRPTVCR